MSSSVSPENKLSQSISEAAFDPAKWRDVCDGFADISKSIGALIVPVAMELRAAKFPHSVSFEGLVERYQKHEWYKRDVRERGLPAVYERGFMLDEDCIDYYKIDKSGYFEEFLKPVGTKWFAGLGFGDASNLCIMSLQRTGKHEPFTHDEIAPLLRFRSQVEASLALAKSLDFERLGTISSILEHQNRCVIGLNAGGRATYFSPAAETMIGDAIDVSEGWMRAKIETDNTALRRVIAALTYAHNQFADSGPIKLSRTNGKPPLVAYGNRLPESQYSAFRPAVAIIILVDPEIPQDMPTELFMDYFGITRAEARLAISLAKGVPLDQHAKDSAISISTARNHLQSLLSKTTTHSTAQLVALLNRVVY